jgi:hypothetical protein
MTKPLSPPKWTAEELNTASSEATRLFRQQRMREPLEAYLDHFDARRAAVEDLIELTVDLSRLGEQATTVLTNPELLEAVRYLAGPPISADDLKIVAELRSLAPSRFEGDPETARKAVETILLGLDRRRFPWYSEGREPTEAEREAAVVSTTSLIATRRVMTARAHEGKETQELAVANRLESEGFEQVEPRTITTLREAPGAGAFCRESMFGTRKADLVVGLWDGRVMPIECKVSNSSTNSIKRLNNDAAAKAKSWLREFGHLQTVPAAVLSGVFKPLNLSAAQEDGLTLWWAHNLWAMSDWIGQTR